MNYHAGGLTAEEVAVTNQARGVIALGIARMDRMKKVATLSCVGRTAMAVSCAETGAVYLISTVAMASKTAGISVTKRSA